MTNELAPFDPAKVTITRKRVSTTQGSALVEYAGHRIENYGDAITLHNGEWVGLPDADFIDAARREAIKRGLCAAPVQTFTFDVKMFAAISVQASSEAEAIAMLKQAIDGANANFGAWANGDPITGDVGMDGEPDLTEIDGEAA